MRVSSIPRRPRRTVCASGSSSRSANRSVSCHPRAAVAAQQRAQPRQQLLERERLDEVVVGAGVQAADPVGHGVARGQQQHRRAVPRRAQAPADLEPVHPRHQQSSTSASGAPLGERIERLLPVRGQLGVVALHPQRAVDGVAHRRLVVDHQDAHTPGGCAINLRDR